MNEFTDQPDEQLFGLLKEDSEQAFTVLYNRYWEKLLEVAFYKLQSQEDAEEAVQQVFTQIWAHRHQTSLKYTFRTYISAALKYTIYAKFAQRRKLNILSTEGLTTDHFIDDSTQQWLIFEEIRGKIESIVAQLPDKCRIVYRMSREEGLSLKEISEKLNINQKTVEGHLTKALKIIRGRLHEGLPGILIPLAEIFTRL